MNKYSKLIILLCAAIGAIVLAAAAAVANLGAVLSLLGVVAVILLLFALEELRMVRRHTRMLAAPFTTVQDGRARD